MARMSRRSPLLLAGGVRWEAQSSRGGWLPPDQVVHEDEDAFKLFPYYRDVCFSLDQPLVQVRDYLGDFIEFLCVRIAKLSIVKSAQAQSLIAIENKCNKQKNMFVYPWN